MNLERIAALVRAAENRGLAMLDYSEGVTRLAITFSSDESASILPMQEAPAETLPAGAALPDPPRLPGVTSPGVGIFRRAHPAGGVLPGEGEEVGTGAVVGFVQAGSLLQPVTAPRKGRLGAALIADGAPVAYAGLLFGFD